MYYNHYQKVCVCVCDHFEKLFFAEGCMN